MSLFPTKILLATDGSEDAAQATQAATDLSSKSGSELHVVHVWHDVPGPYRHGYVKRELRRQGQEILDAEIQKIEESGGKAAQAHLRGGRTTEEVVELGDELDAGLLVVGSRGLQGMRRILIGSHSEDIVHHARLPVLVVKCGEGSWPPSRVVVGEDFSGDARKAGELAANIARLLNARMLLLNAGPHLPRASGGEARETEEKLEGRAGELEEILGERPETGVATGDPADALIRAAQNGETSLVAVGSRGLKVVERVRLGSVSTKVLRAALAAVLVLPHAGGR
ncbi:MAG TPA: universal stress protein [Rubrobacteraceae bacterium]|nr:universal stress protein [Rubrobacteraceae bacterium]